MMRFSLNQPYCKAFARTEARDTCFYCKALVVIPGDHLAPTVLHDYVIPHQLQNGEECPMSELQRELDSITQYDLAMAGDLDEWDSDVPLE